MKTIKPTPSYQIVLPDGVQEQVDGTVSSFWINGDPILLQTSSYVREGGEHLSASQRLKDRMLKQNAHWQVWNEQLCLTAGVDQAIGEFTGDDGVVWIHSYFVWPHLTVYATVSGPGDTVRNRKNWALQSLRGVALNIQ
ncbi:MAG TPA: hypothetical protein VGT04_01505 [Acidobacteriaceae bacterium]|nr:hypothetical protein [Acidobacteriaceae bacterium]